jgi:hypothetical protein
MKYSPIEIARQFLYVREAAGKPNRGVRVEAIQHWSGGQGGDSWCCEFWWMCNDIANQGNFVLPRVQACQDVYDYGKKNKLVVSVPQVGDTFLYVNDADHAHHIGFVTALTILSGIAGNTSADGTSDNGDRVAEHGLILNTKHLKFVRFPK